MKKILALYEAHKEMLAYLFFGGLCTLLNIVLGFVFKLLGMPTMLNSVLDNIICILFAFVTNRIWVFHSQNKGMAAVREFISFIVCRLGTLVLDMVIMVVGIDWIGNMLIPNSLENIWFLAVKLFAQVLVIVLNYVFSKVFIFKKED